MDTIKKYFLHIFLLITLAMAFAHNNSISLWDQDEAAYAGFAKNMLASKNWLIPNFMWSDPHRKPPLHFWNISLSYLVFGVNEFSVRFSSTVCILLTYLIVYLWGRKNFTEKVSLLSIIVLSTTLFVPFLAKVAVTDATLLFFSTLCALSVINIIQQRHILFVIIFWISFALALLTKGPPIIIFCSVLVGILFILHPNRKNLFYLQPWYFLPLAVAPLIIWGYLTTRHDDGALINWMLDWYVLKRINGSVFGQSGPPGTHLLLIIVFFIPYLMFFPRAIWTGIRGIITDKGENLLLGAWFVSGWVIYEFSPSKLPSYTVVAHVPLAILIGKAITANLNTNTIPKKGLIILQFLGLLLLTSGLLVACYFMDLSYNLKLSLIILNILMISGITVALKYTRPKIFIYSILGMNLLFHLMINFFILPEIDIYKNSTKRTAIFIQNNAVQESIIVLANKDGHPPSLPFYSSLFFDTVIEEDNFNQLSTLYQSKKPYVFVLNEKQKNQFMEHYSSLEFQKINSLHTDRKGQLNYYILMNDWSKQKSVK